MNVSQIRQLLTRVADGSLETEIASQQLLAALRDAPFDDLGFARVDHHRELRQGFPEVILATGKTASQIAAIAASVVARHQSLLVTRAMPEAYEAVLTVAPDARYHADARAITLLVGEIARGRGTVLVACAGTSDLSVAEEAAVTAEVMGNVVERIYDVGVAGIHRLLHERARLEAASVIIVVAGMEGALPSVIGGLVDVPVIGVPTSVGYGASFGGLAALLGMLNSCASGVAVMNIDNGFGAACLASRINHL